MMPLLAAFYLLLFGLFSYLFFPMAAVDLALGRALGEHGLRLSGRAHKLVIPGLAWESPRLLSERGELVVCERVTLRTALVAEVAGGTLRLALHPLAGRGSLQVEKLDLSRIPLFKTVLGADVTGTLKADGDFTGSAGTAGELRTEISGLGFTGAKIGDLPLPDAAGLTSRGMIRVSSAAARVESLTLEGEGVYMRLSGAVPLSPDAALSLVLEIMPKPEFLARQQAVFLLLARYQVSPGVYRLPIGGTILRPQLT